MASAAGRLGKQSQQQQQQPPTHTATQGCINQCSICVPEAAAAATPQTTTAERAGLVLARILSLTQQNYGYVEKPCTIDSGQCEWQLLQPNNRPTRQSAPRP